MVNITDVILVFDLQLLFKVINRSIVKMSSTTTLISATKSRNNKLQFDRMLNSVMLSARSKISIKICTFMSWHNSKGNLIRHRTDQLYLPCYSLSVYATLYLSNIIVISFLCLKIFDTLIVLIYKYYLLRSFFRNVYERCKRK